MTFKNRLIFNQLIKDNKHNFIFRKIYLLFNKQTNKNKEQNLFCNQFSSFFLNYQRIMERIFDYSICFGQISTTVRIIVKIFSIARIE